MGNEAHAVFVETVWQQVAEVSSTLVTCAQIRKADLMAQIAEVETANQQAQASIAKWESKLLELRTGDIVVDTRRNRLVETGNVSTSASLLAALADILTPLLPELRKKSASKRTEQEAMAIEFIMACMRHNPSESVAKK